GRVARNRPPRREDRTSRRARGRVCGAEAVWRLRARLRHDHLRLPRGAARELPRRHLAAAGTGRSVRRAHRRRPEPERQSHERSDRAGGCRPEEACAGEERTGRILKPKMAVLSALLVIALGAVVWQGRTAWSDAQAKRRTTLNAKAAPIPAPPLSPAPKPGSATAINYADVANKDLFSKDRNPNVVIEPPAPVVEKKMPPLPVVYGVLGLPSGTKALMSEKPGE